MNKRGLRQVALANADARRLYDLANAPLLRATLVTLADDEYVLILNFHHIIADGSSLAIFYRELAALYDAARDGKKCHLPSLRFSTRTSLLGSTSGSSRDAFDIQLAYWKRQLANLPTPVELPTDFDRPALLSTYRGAR